MLAFFHNLHKRLCIIILPSTSKLNSVNLYLPLTQFNYAGRLVSQYHKFGQSFSWESQIAFVFVYCPGSCAHPEKLCNFFLATSNHVQVRWNTNRQKLCLERQSTNWWKGKPGCLILTGQLGCVASFWSCVLSCKINSCTESDFKPV